MQVIFMKLRMKEQLICILLTLMLFVVGMQADIKPVNPSFLRGERMVSENTAYSTIRSGTYLTAVEKTCTIDMIRKSVSTYQNSNYNRITVRRFFEVTILLLITELFLLQRFYFSAAIEGRDIESMRCHIATIQYIHQKDGKK